MNLSKFAETLEELISDFGINRKELARTVNIDAASVTKYLQAQTVPTVKNIVKLADYFNCSVDFLIGLNDESAPKAFLPCPPTGERLAEILDKNGYSGYRFCKEAKLNEPRFYEWLSGKHQPSLENIIIIAKFLGVSVDYVLGREK